MDVKFNAVICYREQFEKGRSYYPVSAKRFVREEDMREQWVVSREAACHPRGVGYYAPAAARAVVHAVERPGSVVAGFSALALYGLPYLVEGADTLLFSPTAPRSTQGGELTPTVRRPSRAVSSTWTLTHRGVPFKAAAPADAVVQALQQVRRGEHGWGTVKVAGWAARDVMALQLIDCARRFLDVPAPDVLGAARGKVDAKWLRPLLASSSALADSPKETEMRLLVTALAHRYGYTVREQMPLIVDGEIVTVFDLAIPELNIAIMYDGEHHWEWKQRNKDSSINLKIASAGWTPARCSSTTMFECLAFIEEVMQKSSAQRPA